VLPVVSSAAYSVYTAQQQAQDDDYDDDYDDYD
jgi:hypothetical protein